MTSPRERIIDPDEAFPARSDRPPLRLADEPEPMPDPDEQTQRQIVEAVYRIHEDTSCYPRFPWAALDDIAGPMAPSEFWIVAARTGNGKTLFMLNLFDDLVRRQGVSTFYIGLEQTPAEMRTKWACMVTGMPAIGVLAGKWPLGWTTERIQDAKFRVQEAFAAQKAPELRALARFCEARFIDAARLRYWTTWAVEQGAQVVILDHLNRIARDEHRTSFDGHSHVVTTAKELAVEHQIVMLAASQVGRPNGDPIQRFTPPALNELRGGGTSEEEANVVLAVYRPLLPTATDKAIQAVRRGLAEETTLYEPDQMAVRVLKHRLDGMLFGRQTILRVEHGRLLDRFARA